MIGLLDENKIFLAVIISTVISQGTKIIMNAIKDKKEIKVVYKPRSVDLEKKFQEYLLFINPSLKRKLKTKYGNGLKIKRNHHPVIIYKLLAKQLVKC